MIETDDFDWVLSKLERYRGRTMRVSSGKDNAVFALSSGILLRVHVAGKKHCGVALIACTGSKAHLRKLIAVTGPIKRLRSNRPRPTETALYRKFGVSFIQPELREGNDEPTTARYRYTQFPATRLLSQPGRARLYDASTVFSRGGV